MIPTGFLLVVMEWVFLIYFLGINIGYFSLNMISVGAISRHMQEEQLVGLPDSYEEFMPPVSILVPAYNEEEGIIQTARSVLQLNYPAFEIIVINDGSTDGTLEKLREEFECRLVEETGYHQLDTADIRGFYRSDLIEGLRVVDKENGGKADALNAGINAARYPLFCAIDGDSVLERDSLKRLVEPFAGDADTVACGGSIRLANGCKIEEGFMSRVGLPGSLLGLFQVIEYLRAFLFGRMGWSPLNGLLIISGAFGLFDRRAVLEAGGYRPDTVAEDMELVMRLHRLGAEKGDRKKIKFVPDPICWTEGPEDIESLRNQRIRWQRGLAESMWYNRGLLFKPGSGAAGWLAFPFWLVFECCGPLIESAGYLFIALGFILGYVAPEVVFVFFILAIGIGMLLSVLAFFLEEISYRVYPEVTDAVILFFTAVLENFGYRQVNSYWRLIGLLRWLTGRRKGEWGKIKRKGFKTGRESR